MKKKLFILSGPTACGKTALSIEIAQKWGAEIISADSRQVYKYMNIGTAKIIPEEMKGIKHHLVDFVDPKDFYTAHNFCEDAKKVLDQNKNCIVVGGTIFYIQALIAGAVSAPASDPEISEKLSIEYKEDPEKIYNELTEKDHLAASKIHQNDMYRIVRALSVIRSTGKPYSSFLQREEKESIDSEFVAIKVDREELYKKINLRVEHMVEQGLFEEVESLLNMGYEKNLKAFQTFGYREVIQFLDSELTKDKCIEKIQRESRRFAKRQLSWLRSLSVEFLTPDELWLKYCN